MLNNYLLTVSQQASLFLTMNAGMSFMSVLDSGYRHGVEYMRGRDAQTVRERQTVSPHAPLHPSRLPAVNQEQGQTTRAKTKVS